MLILGLLGMHFDAWVVFFTFPTFFRMAMAVLCSGSWIRLEYTCLPISKPKSYLLGVLLT